MLEQIYQDFTTKLLPQIKEGLVITKDYFLDLFGRYVKYLIITDAIELGIGLIISVGAGIVAYKLIQDEEYALVALLLIPIIIGLIFFFTGLFNLIKDIYIPEVRVMEELQYYIR